MEGKGPCELWMWENGNIMRKESKRERERPSLPAPNDGGPQPLLKQIIIFIFIIIITIIIVTIIFILSISVSSPGATQACSPSARQTYQPSHWSVDIFKTNITIYISTITLVSVSWYLTKQTSQHTYQPSPWCVNILQSKSYQAYMNIEHHNILSTII